MAIDTLEYVKKLEAAGIDRKQAEAHAQAASGLIAGQAATKPDLDNAALRLEGRIDRGVARLDGRLDLLTWMVGFNLAATLAVLWRLLR
jgi:hypothetical protein